MASIRGDHGWIPDPAKQACEQIPQDIRYGLRALRRNPGFAAVAILTLALGTGVNTAVFSVVNAVLLRPLPYPDAGRLIAFSNGINGANPGHFKPGILGADFAEWRKGATSFEKIAGYFYEDATVATPGMAYQARVISIAGDFWSLTGAYPALGVLFEPRDSQDSIVLTYSVFERQFKSDRAIVGKIVLLDGRPRTVTGVLPAAFRFQFAQNWWSWLAATEPGAFIPAPPPVRSKPSRLFVVGRLKPLVTTASALAEIRGIETAILKHNPDRWFPGVARMILVPLETQLAGNNRQGLLILQVAGAFVLLIACANIASLLLARGAARVHEMGIRVAMGAGATRILRQFLVEGIVLALLGGAAGLIVGKLLIWVLLHFGANAIPRLEETSIDPRVLSFTFGLSLGSGIVFGFGPALALRTDNLQDILKQGARTLSAHAEGGAGDFSVRRFLVAAELALAIVLLTGAGLMVKSFWKMYANPPGFAPENTLVMKIGLSGPWYKDTARQVTYLTELQDRLRSMPGVKELGIANIQDYILQSKDNSAAVDQFRETLASADYFEAIGMRLLKGRWFTDSDAPDATIINETMARRVFGGKDPLGREIKQLGRQVRVIGVAADLRYAKLDADPAPEIFRPYRQNLWGGNPTITVAARMAGDPLGIAPAFSKTAAGIDPAQAVYDVQSLEQALAKSICTRRFEFFLLGTFAVAALIMAAVGVYGVMAFSVTQRTREIGIRMALGAQRSQVVRMIVSQGAAIGIWGIVTGLCATYGLARLMASFLYGVAPNDPAIFLATASFLFAVVGVASWIPGFRAALGDPAATLRAD